MFKRPNHLTTTLESTFPTRKLQWDQSLPTHSDVKLAITLKMREEINKALYSEDLRKFTRNVYTDLLPDCMLPPLPSLEHKDNSAVPTSRDGGSSESWSLIFVWFIVNSSVDPKTKNRKWSNPGAAGISWPAERLCLWYDGVLFCSFPSQAEQEQRAHMVGALDSGCSVISKLLNSRYSSKQLTHSG